MNYYCLVCKGEYDSDEVRKEVEEPERWPREQVMVFCPKCGYAGDIYSEDELHLLREEELSWWRMQDDEEERNAS